MTCKKCHTDTVKQIGHTKLIWGHRDYFTCLTCWYTWYEDDRDENHHCERHP